MDGLLGVAGIMKMIVSKWVISRVKEGISRVNPLMTELITHLVSGMNHQVLSTTKK